MSIQKQKRTHYGLTLLQLVIRLGAAAQVSRSVDYRREVSGAVYLVAVSMHGEGDMIKPGTLWAIIRQSGLPERLFRS